MERDFFHLSSGMSVPISRSRRNDARAAFFRLLAGRAAQIDAQDDGDLVAEGARHGV